MNEYKQIEEEHKTEIEEYKKERSNNAKFKITLSDTESIKKSFAVMKTLFNEAKINVNNKRLTIIEMDPVNVCLVMFNLYGSGCIEWNISQELEIGVNVSNLYESLKKATKNDIVVLEYDKSKGDYLYIHLKNKNTKTSKLPLIDLSDNKPQKIPELNFNVEIKTNAKDLKTELEFLKEYESVTFEVVDNITDREFNIYSEGEFDSSTINIKESEETIIKTTENVKTKYSNEYLKKIVNSFAISPEVTIKYSKDYPLFIEYKKIDLLSLGFILAPRVESD